jgi:choline dehydrogenase-like flavoprotein
VSGTTAAGADFTVRAKHAVVLAASAIQTPVLLRQSGLTRGPVGDGLTAHPGVSVTGKWDEPIASWRGATQGHEVTGYRGEGLKLEALGFDVSLLASRVPGVGGSFAARLRELDRYAVWGAAVRAEAKGSVRPGPVGPIVRYSITPADARKVRRGVRVLGETMLAAGAREVYPGVPGFDAVVTDAARMARFEDEGSLVPSDYSMSMTHLFGTTRMGSDPKTSVVGPRFAHHDAAGLFVADSGVFPGNLGVNPQIPIMAMARLSADHVLAR